MKKRIRGSLTVFFAFTMMMIVSLSFALTEVIHVVCLSQQADIVSDAAGESTFSDYNRFLWENYGLLAIDSGYCNDFPNFGYLDARMRTIATENANPFRAGLNFFRLNTVVCESAAYALLSDDNGSSVIKEGALWAKTKLPAEMISSFFDDASTAKSSKERAGDLEKKLEDASDIEVKAMKKMQEGNNNADPIEGSGIGADIAGNDIVPPEDPPDNPVDLLMELKGNSLLDQIFGGDIELSSASVNLPQKPSARTLNHGTLSPSDSISDREKITLMDKTLFALYLKENFQCYTNSLDHDGLAYEWEYVLMGNDCDKYNLSDVIGSLLLMREAENFASIRSDSAKTNEVKALATAIISWTGVPGLDTVLELGIEAAWAYLESVLDVRLLMSGGRVSVIKTKEEWTSSLETFASYFPASVKANNCEKGLRYEDYLVLLTTLSDPDKLGANSLDLLENAMYQNEDYKSCRIDNHIYEMTMDFSFSATPTFFQLIPYSWGTIDPYSFKRKRQLSYLKT